MKGWLDYILQKIFWELQPRAKSDFWWFCARGYKWWQILGIIGFFNCEASSLIQEYKARLGQLDLEYSNSRTFGIGVAVQSLEISALS